VADNAQDGAADRLQHLLRLLLSWREKAERRLHGGDKNATPLEFDAGRFSSQAEYCAWHRGQAVRHLNEVREEGRQYLLQLGKELQQLLRQQEALKADAASGKRSAEEANAENRRLRKAIEAQRHILARLNQLLGAANAEDAGGYYDMPLRSYGKQFLQDSGGVLFPKSGKRGTGLFSPLTRVDRFFVLLALMVLAMLAAGTVYYTMLRHDIVFKCGLPEERNAPLCLYAENRGFNDIWLQAPGVEGRRSWQDAPLYSVAVEARLPGEKKWRRFPAAGAAWRHEGVAAWRGEPVRIPAGVRIQIYLDLAALEAPGLDWEALRVRCIDHKGHTVYTCGTGPLLPARE
jgi:hypothetical protein